MAIVAFKSFFSFTDQIRVAPSVHLSVVIGVSIVIQVIPAFLAETSLSTLDHCPRVRTELLHQQAVK